MVCLGEDASMGDMVHCASPGWDAYFPDKTREGVVDSREEIAAVLRDRDFQITGVGTPWEAVRELEKKPFDSVLVEVGLPEIDGIELVRTICDRYPTLLPILIAARPSVESAAAAVRVGAFDYLFKPIDHVRLGSTVSEAVHAKRILSRRSTENPREEDGGAGELLSRLNHYLAEETRERQQQVLDSLS